MSDYINAVLINGDGFIKQIQVERELADSTRIRIPIGPRTSLLGNVMNEIGSSRSLV